MAAELQQAFVCNSSLTARTSAHNGFLSAYMGLSLDSSNRSNLEAQLSRERKILIPQEAFVKGDFAF